MSSSAQGGPGGRGDKPQFLVKYIKKAGKVLKRAASSKGPPSDLPAEPGQNAPAVASRYAVALQQFHPKTSLLTALTQFRASFYFYSSYHSTTASSTSISS